STFHPSHLNQTYQNLSKIYHYLVKQQTLLKTNLQNPNPQLHPPPTLFNLPPIHYSQHFSLYKQPITKHTLTLLHPIHIQRLNLPTKLPFQ
ncbi:NAD/NADP octopine/nopaline dehydrogenase family protein, partial [Staphylococcus epidermidis]|uniref:NAD/NADP octopine/nopaline dehydrogenase family protein n=1 Tax=Staphylococcus epidermidis TaxID=1282 RepID=UPI001C935174